MHSTHNIRFDRASVGLSARCALYLCLFGGFGADTGGEYTSPVDRATGLYSRLGIRHLHRLTRQYHAPCTMHIVDRVHNRT